MKTLFASLLALAFFATALLAGDQHHIHITVPAQPAPTIHPAFTPLPGPPPPFPIPSVAPIPNVTPATPSTSGVAPVLPP